MNTAIVNIALIVSVLLGGLLVSFLKKSKNEQIIKLTLAFSGGFLLSIGFIHFIPELYAHHEFNVGIYILMGFLVQLILEFFSGGIEHGHVHAHHHAKIPMGLVVALSVHSILEGIPLGSQLGGFEIATSQHHGNDQTLLYGILFHRIPVAIALMTLLVTSGITTTKSWLILAFFAITAPIGVIFGYYSGAFSPNFNFNIILAIVVGMFLHISTTIIFETSENHKFNLFKLLLIFSGCGLAFLLH